MSGTWLSNTSSPGHFAGSSFTLPIFLFPISKVFSYTCSYYPQKGLLFDFPTVAERTAFHLVHERCVFAPSASVVWCCSAAIVRVVSVHLKIMII